MAINALGRSIFNNNDIYLNLPSSKFKVDISVKDSFMMGRLIPVGTPIEVLKNDYFALELAGLIRTGSALVAPILDDMFVDCFSFWIPKRVVWNKMAQFLGENDATAWTQNAELEEPTFTYKGNLRPGGILGNISAISIGNYYLDAHFGLPYAVRQVGSDIKITALMHRAYYYVWNQYFRFTEWQRPVLFSKENDGSAGEFGYALDTFNIMGTDGSVLDTVNIGTSFNYQFPMLMPVNRFYDSFTSIKPEPQFGDAVDIFGDATQEIVGNGPLVLKTILDNGTISGGSFNMINGSVQSGGTGSLSTVNYSGLDVPQGRSVYSSGLTANIALDVSKLRSAVLLQNFKQAIGRTDARVDSILQLLFGPGKSGFEDDRPRLLNHFRQRVGVNQIVATADSEAGSMTSHLGETGAYSITALSGDLVHDRFTEPGYIMTLIAVRQVNTYSQGIPEAFRRFKFWKQFNPFTDKIGMVPFEAISIDARSDADLVVGYQEAHYSYKSSRGIAVGALNPAIPDAYNFWTLGTVYTAFNAQAGIGPGSFIQGPTELDRALLANHDVAPQFIADFRIHGTAERKMSVHGDSLVMGMRL